MYGKSWVTLQHQYTCTLNDQALKNSRGAVYSSRKSTCIPAISETLNKISYHGI